MNLNENAGRGRSNRTIQKRNLEGMHVIIIIYNVCS